MAVIVTRAGKGSPLTNNEVDANFVNLNNEVGTKADAGANSDITSMTGLTGQVGTPLAIQFADGTTVPLAAGKLWYNGTTGSLNFGMGNGNITQQVGEEIFVYGKASAAITEGQLVCRTGVVGASGVITFAPSPTGLPDNDGIIGVATENIALNGFGRITYFGLVRNINTTGSSVGETWADGDVLWYNPAYAGGLTKVKPTAPNIKYQVATVINASAGAGELQVNLLPGSQLGGTDSNVQLGSLTDGDVLQYNATTGYWSNATPAGGVTLANDTATATDLYPTFASATTGSVSTIYTGNARLRYKPSTGELKSTTMVATNGIVVNSATVSESYTIPTGSNAVSAGPVSVASGVTVTVSAGSVWTIT